MLSTPNTPINNFGYIYSPGDKDHANLRSCSEKIGGYNVANICADTYTSSINHSMSGHIQMCGYKFFKMNDNILILK